MAAKQRKLRVVRGDERYRFVLGDVVESLQDVGVATDEAIAIARDTESHFADGKKRIPLDKEISLDVGAEWRGTSKTAAVDRLKLTSSVATMDGKGGATLDKVLTVRPSTLTLDADLAALAAKLGAVLERPPALAGWSRR